jgi:NAD(P)-dependent dehydrogenase (short-subunit alcohol dehydrogenase family)
MSPLDDPRDRSFVVTGGSQGIGRAIVEHLSVTGHVVVIDTHGPVDAVDETVTFIEGDASDRPIAIAAALAAEDVAPLVGWVNNAAVFRDASLSTASASEIMDAIAANLALTVRGCHAAVNHFLFHDRPGSIVNVSSHQAQRAVRGALPYATSKAAIEGFTRAAAVDHGPDGIRVNAVALGSIATDRYDAYRHDHPEVEQQMAALHPLGRVGGATEVARVVGFLLSEEASFITGSVIPVDGGRSAQGADPEAR